jgi:hypothetical protein
MAPHPRLHQRPQKLSVLGVGLTASVLDVPHEQVEVALPEGFREHAVHPARQEFRHVLIQRVARQPDDQPGVPQRPYDIRGFDTSLFVQSQ